MRRAAGLLLAIAALAVAGCGGGDAQGPSAGDAEYAGQQTRDAGSVGEQLSAEGVSELEELREQVAAQCEGGDAPRLDATVRGAVRIASQARPDAIVDLSQADRALNIRDFLGRMAKLLERCGAESQAERLSSAEFGTRLER